MLEMAPHNDQVMRVYIGYDQRSDLAYRVADHSLRRHASLPVTVTPLKADVLASSGLLWRPVDYRGGELYDITSNAPCSTAFANSRFLVPLLAQHGFVLFIDCDMVFMSDVEEIFNMADPTKAVQVVQHDYVPTLNRKMVGATQTRYTRKNWSSVMLWNCDHPANRRLSLEDINRRPGRDLHALYWLSDSEIGHLSQACNWLVGEQPRPARSILAHFTNGGPWIEGWRPSEHDQIWIDAKTEMESSCQRGGL